MGNYFDLHRHDETSFFDLLEEADEEDSDDWDDEDSDDDWED